MNDDERLRSSMAEQRFCEPPVAGSSPAVGFLTDAEREAIERAAFALNGGEDWSPDVGTKDKQACVTLRSLLERTK